MATVTFLKGGFKFIESTTSFTNFPSFNLMGKNNTLKEIIGLALKEDILFSIIKDRTL